MKTNILNYINKLQGYKTAIKNLHWSSKNMSEHKLLDDIADSVANNQDEIAEMCQGIYGKIKINELKPKKYQITNSKKMLFDMLKDTKSFYSTIKGRELSGVRSVVEAFIGEINKFIYLMEMCIKEDIKRNLLNPINETNMNVSENEFRTLIREAIHKTLNEDVNPSNINAVVEYLDKKMDYDAYSIEMAQNEYMKEIQYIKKYIPLIIEKINGITTTGSINYEVDELDEALKIYVELPSIQGFTNDDDYTNIESQIYTIQEEMRKYIDCHLTLEDEPQHNQNAITVLIEIFNLPSQLTIKLNYDVEF